jgi:hypothetical protein
MATRQECEGALRTLAARLDEAARSHPGARPPDRTVRCTLPDLGTSFAGVLRGGSLIDIAEQDETGVADPPAQVVFTIRSDDLIDLVDGRLAFATAWTSGRLKISASLRDLLRVRSLL